MSDAVAGEQLGEGAVLDVAEAVVGHQPLRHDPVLSVEGERALEEAGHRRGSLVVVELDEGEPGMVVDDRVREVVADPCPDTPAAQGLGAIAGDAVAWPQEARVAAGVHVQQVAGAGPLVAVGWLLDRPRRSRDLGPLEHLPDGQVREAGRAGDQARPPTRLASAGADRLGELGGELPRRAMRPARAVKQARQAAASLLAALQPAMPPAMRR